MFSEESCGGRYASAKRRLGFDEPFLHEIAPKVIEQMGDFYPEIVEA